MNMRVGNDIKQVVSVGNDMRRIIEPVYTWKMVLEDVAAGVLMASACVLLVADTILLVPSLFV